ncbi:MAG: FkbM family methyltransferase [Aquisalinus sp.]|nr:FkbM family methyltransferase [Aquisalinus sp.]
MSEENETYNSQKKQDIWVDKTLKKKRDGYFLELGAADGILHSNSLFFEKYRNWHGVLIEAIDDQFEKLVKNRNSTCLKAVVNDEPDIVKFRPDRRQGSGIVADDTDNNYRVRADELKTAEIVEIQARTLTSILDECNAPKIIDYFSLDVEGAEARVLRSVDFNKYVFGLLTIERANAECNQILRNNGYVFVKNFQNDNFYAHASYSEEYDIKYSDEWYDIPAKEW